MGYPIEKIRESIQRTGFSTELKTIQELLKQGWQTVHSTTYVDTDESKSREIDALAVRQRDSGTPFYGFAFHIVAEVKHSENPWICFSSKPAHRRSSWSIVHATNTRGDSSKVRNKDWLPLLSGSCSMDEHLRAGRQRIGRAFHEMSNETTDKKVGQDHAHKNRPLAGLRQMTKASQFFADQLQKRRDESVDGSLYHPSIDVFHPILVFDHELYEVYLDEHGNEVIEQKDWMPVEITYSSPTTRKGIWGDSYFPDIVTLVALPKYLESVEAWRLSMIREMDEELATQMVSIPKKPKKAVSYVRAGSQPSQTKWEGR